MKDENQEHPGPEVLVDLVEGAIVDVVWKDHVSRCGTCAKEVETLRTALHRASANEVPEPDEDYWDGFNARLQSRIDEDRKNPRKRRVWAVVAAAVVAFGFWTSPYWMDAMRPSPTVSIEVMLPPVEEDDEYQALLAFAEILTDSETWAEAFEDQPYTEFDPSLLTPDETEVLRRNLERDIEGMDHAKS